MATKTTTKKKTPAKKPAPKKAPVKKPVAKKSVAKVTKKAVVKPVKAKKSSAKLKVKKPTLSFRQAMGLLVFVGVALFAVSIGIWWHSIVMDPQRALSGMLSKSLSTQSVTRVVNQQDQGSDIKQVVRISFVPSATALTETTMKQPDGTGQTSTVVTEAIGTPTSNYVRYTAIDTPGQQANFSSILNVWGKQDVPSAADAPSSGFLNEAAVGIVPIGNLKPIDKGKVLAILEGKKVFSNYSSVHKEKKDGRQVFVYEMNIKLADLVEALGVFAGATGLGDAKQFDPAAYAAAEPLTVEMTVDILSRHLVSINYTGSARQEQYSGYGMRNAVTVPEQSISLDELQSRIQSVQ